MYIPSINLVTDKVEIIAFMQQYSFATIITATNDFPIATHLPFTIAEKNNEIILTSHFAKANNQWKDMIEKTVLVIFNEPNAYISPKHYTSQQNVPTWNYMSVHAYGKAKIITDTEESFSVLETMIDTYDKDYTAQWNHLSETYKNNLLQGIVAFEIVVTDLQGKKKISQNKSLTEQKNIIEALSTSPHSNECSIASLMKKNLT